MRSWLQFVKFEECYNKKACIKILRQSHLFHCRNCMWPNSDFPERAISGPIVNAVYLLRCGRICCRHVFVPDLFLYVGRWWNSYCHIPRQVKMREFRAEHCMEEEKWVQGNASQHWELHDHNNISLCSEWRSKNTRKRKEQIVIMGRNSSSKPKDLQQKIKERKWCEGWTKVLEENNYSWKNLTYSK